MDVSTLKYSKTAATSTGMAVVEVEVEVVVGAVEDVEVEERGAVVEVDGWEAGDPVQDDNTAAASTVVSRRDG